MSTQLKDLSTVPYFAPAEDLAQMLRMRTQSNNPEFFRVLTSYHLCKAASMMRVSIQTHDRGAIPINMYAINLAPSGAGKGHSTNIIEEEIMAPFKKRFYSDIYKQVGEDSLNALALIRAKRKDEEPEIELKKVIAEYERLGPTIPFSFDSATAPAVKQLRQKMLMSGVGAINLEIDEIGSNLLANVEVLNTYLELYDVGKVKQKLTKNTAENLRSEEIDGRTPANLLLFGTPDKLLSGGKVEEEFLSFIETGYGRRCLFGYTSESGKVLNLTPEEVYDMMTNSSNASSLTKLSKQLEKMASLDKYGLELEISKDNTLIYLAYKLDCERRAEQLPSHHTMHKAELSHRYFKALKLAGAYAFIDNCDEIEEDHLYAAIRLVEELGDAFQRILTRDKPYVKLANFLAEVGHDVTSADLTEHLPFYKGTAAAKAELFNLASAWAYKNGIVLKRFFTDGIEFFSGEALKPTKEDELILSHSEDTADGYEPVLVSLDDIQNVLLPEIGQNFCNHHFENNHRSDDDTIEGCNMLVLDIDGDFTIQAAQAALHEYEYLIYTTKRHQSDGIDRFRVIIPISHVVNMDKVEYRQMMRNFAEWFPFELNDDSSFQRSKKWLTFSGCKTYRNKGALLDVLQFIPRSNKSDQLKQRINQNPNLTGIERWFMNNTAEGNRNHQLLKYGMFLVDAGFAQDQIEHAVLELNEKLTSPMDELEIHRTIFKSVFKHLSKRG